MQHHISIRCTLAVFLSLIAFATGCHKREAVAPPPPPATVPVPAQPTASLSVDQTLISKGESVRLSWTTTDATTVSIAPELGSVGPEGSTTVTPADSMTYTLTATGEGGTAASTVHVTMVAPLPAPAPESFEDAFNREVRDAFFDYDKADIRSDAQQTLQHDADFLTRHAEARLVIEGYCVERGSTKYNLALGQRRANAVKDYLVYLGVPAANLDTTSYGKEKQFCADHGESCWQENRRGHLAPNMAQASTD